MGEFYIGGFLSANNYLCHCNKSFRLTNNHKIKHLIVDVRHLRLQIKDVVLFIKTTKPTCYCVPYSQVCFRYTVGIPFLGLSSPQLWGCPGVLLFDVYVVAWWQPQKNVVTGLDE